MDMKHAFNNLIVSVVRLTEEMFFCFYVAL